MSETGSLPSSRGDRILAASADYYAEIPFHVEKKRREARSADSSSVHYRRSSVHIRRETRPKTGSTDRFREPHAPSDPGTHTTASLSLSFPPHSSPRPSLRLSPRCRSLQCAFPPRHRASKVSVPLSCRLEAATSATRPRDPRMWAGVFAYLRHISGVGCVISVCIIAHQRYHRWNIIPNGIYCWRIEVDSIFFLKQWESLEKRTCCDGWSKFTYHRSDVNITISISVEREKDCRIRFEFGEWVRSENRSKIGIFEFGFKNYYNLYLFHLLL